MCDSRILRALEAYGDSWLGEDDRLVKKRKAKRDEAETSVQDNSLTKAEGNQVKPTSKKLRELNRMKEELGLLEEPEVTIEPSEQGTEKKGPLVVVFRERKSTKRKEDPASDDDMTGKGSTQEEGFTKAKLDVMKFGIKGLERPKQEEAKIALAVHLGAKPPKNKYVNYKEFIAERQQQKVQAREQKILNAKMGIKPKTKASSSKKSKKGAASKKGSKGKEFHDGIKYVSKQLIAKVKKSSGRRK